MKLIIDPEPYISLPPRYRWLKKKGYNIFSAEKRLTSDQGLRLLEEAKAVVKDMALIPNITYDGPDPEGWGAMARRFQDAGADIIELNMCCPNMSFNTETTGDNSQQLTGASLGKNPEALREYVGIVKESVDIPVIVKITPEGGGIAESAQACVDAGADAVGGTASRLGIPDIDIRKPMDSIYRLQSNITLGCLSGPWIRPLALRDIYEMRSRVGKNPVLLNSGGIRDLSSAVQNIMLGADAVWICTETMLRGFSWMPKLIGELKQYMTEMGYRRISDFRDVLLDNVVPARSLRIDEGHAVVDSNKCTSCGLCWNIGHCTSISHPNSKTVIDKDTCAGCSTCVDVCPTGAIQMIRKTEDD
jgi:dihydroorotate dehydrogenase/Pyruvate/2-oxoacid:ferredoxin oxidoreductase delta subunit